MVNWCVLTSILCPPNEAYFQDFYIYMHVFPGMYARCSNMDFFLGEEDSIISRGGKGPRLNCQGTA